MTVNVLSPSSLVKHMDYSISVLLLRDSALDGIIIKIVKGRQHQGVYYHKVFFRQHFLIEGHDGLVNDCEITLIDKTDSSDPTRREYFWMRLLKTYYPLGLDIEEELQLSYFLEQINMYLYDLFI